MSADREPRATVVGEHLLPVGLLGGDQRLAIGSWGSASWRAPPPGSVAASERGKPELPEQRLRTAERVARAGLDERSRPSC